MIVRSIWLRPMLARPLRTVATVLGVAVGVASVVSTILASQAAVASLGSDVEVIAGKARLEVTNPGGVALADFEALRPICDEVLLAPVVEGMALSPKLGELVRLVGVDILVDTGATTGARSIELNGGLTSVEDARAIMLQANGIALPRDLADALGKAAGDTLELVVRSRRVTLDVAALFDPSPVSAAWDRVVLADVALAQELFGRLDRVDRLELVPRKGGARGEPDTTRLAARVAALLPPGYRVAPASTRREEGNRLVRALEFDAFVRLETPDVRHDPVPLRTRTSVDE